MAKFMQWEEGREREGGKRAGTEGRDRELGEKTQRGHTQPWAGSCLGAGQFLGAGQVEQVVLRLPTVGEDALCVQ